MENLKLRLVFDKGPCEGKILECLPRSAIRIGRVIRGNTFVIKDPDISQKHLVIEFDGGKWTISDLDSSNGTSLNNTKLQPLEPASLIDGDAVKIGEKASFTVQIEKLSDADVNQSQNQHLHRVSTRRIAAKKGAVPVSDVCKNPGSTNIEKDEQIDASLHLSDTQPQRNLPCKPAARRGSTKESLSLIPDICDDPKPLSNSNIGRSDGQKYMEVGLSGKEVEPQLPRRAVARTAAVKKGTSLDTQIDDDIQPLRHVEDTRVTEIQHRRNLPRRAASKRSSTSDADMVSQFPESSKALSNIKVETDVGLSENQSCRNLPPRATTKRPNVSKDPVLVSVVRDDQHTLANSSEKSDKPDDANVSIQKNEPQREGTRRGAAKRGMGKKNAVTVSEVSQTSETSLSRKAEKVDVLDNAIVPDVKVSDGTVRCQGEKVPNDTRSVEDESHLSKVDSSWKDLEKQVLGEWFDRMEKHLPKKINAVGNMVITQLKQREQQFNEFVSSHLHPEAQNQQ